MQRLSCKQMWHEHCRCRHCDKKCKQYLVVHFIKSHWVIRFGALDRSINWWRPWTDCGEFQVPVWKYVYVVAIGYIRGTSKYKVFHSLWCENSRFSHEDLWKVFSFEFETIFSVKPELKTLEAAFSLVETKYRLVKKQQETILDRLVDEGTGPEDELVLATKKAGDKTKADFLQITTKLLRKF